MAVSTGADVTFWDIATGQRKGGIEKTAWYYETMAFSPDGKSLATGAGMTPEAAVGESGIWDVRTGKLLRSLLGYQDEVKSIAFSPDGSRLVSASTDSTVCLWDVASGRELAAMLPMPDVAAESAQARPIKCGAKAIEMGAKAIELGAKPLEVGAKPVGGGAAGPQERPAFVKRFIFQAPLPLGAEIVLQQPGVKPVPGRLYALCVGVSRYRRGTEPGGPAPAAGSGRVSNLKFPAIDAQAVVSRLQQEGKPLYEQMEVYQGKAYGLRGCVEEATIINSNI